MADLILGEPTDFTVMSAGVLGNQRVTFAPWELDWEIYSMMNPGHRIANTTTGNSFPITAKGGSEHLGYWFEVDTVAGTWASGQRCTPQRQAAINQFASFFLATLAMANDDVFLVWYADATNRRTWTERLLWVDEGGSAYGMLSRCQIELIPSADDIECVMNGGNLLPMAGPTQIVNFGLASAGENAIRYAPTAGAQWVNGPGILIRRCRIHAGVNGVYIDRCNAGTCVIGACVFTGCVNGILLPADAAEVYVYYNLAADCLEGYHLVPADTVTRNCIASECGVGFAATPGGAAALNCAATDASLTAGPTNLLNQDCRLNLRFFHDYARPGDKAFDFDFRTHYDSVVRGRGVAVGYAPLAWDMDGRVRPGPPSIGPWEPRAAAYCPSAELIRGASKRGVVA